MNQRLSKNNIEKGDYELQGTAQIIYKMPKTQGQVPRSSNTPPPPKPQK